MVNSPKCRVYFSLDAQHYAFSCLSFSYQSTPVMSKKIVHAERF